MKRAMAAIYSLSACATLPAPVAPQTTSFAQLMETHQAILVGEFHGTNEMPAVFSDLVRQAASTNKKVLVALEFDRTWQNDLDAFVRTSSETDAIPFARYRTADGRTSDAMRTMLGDFQELSKTHTNIHVNAVDWNASTSQPTDHPSWIPPKIRHEKSRRDIEMGKAAIAACAAISCDLLLYYAGNAHTKIKPSESATLNIQTGEITPFMNFPAGAYIAHELQTTAIYLSHRGGTLNARTTLSAAEDAHRRPGNTPDYVIDDHVIYATSNDQSAHPYIMSVGEITGSIDPFNKGNRAPR